MNQADSYRRQIPPRQVRQHRLFARRGQRADHPLTSRITRDVRKGRHRRPDCRLPPLPVSVAKRFAVRYGRRTYRGPVASQV